MKDIGVIIDADLKFEKHIKLINSKIVTANKMLGIIKRYFMYFSAEVFIPLCKAMVKSHFDYAMIIWIDWMFNGIPTQSFPVITA